MGASALEQRDVSQSAGQLDAEFQVEQSGVSVETLRQIFDLSPVGMAAFGPDGQLNYANGAFEKLLGYTPDQLQAQAQPLQLVDILRPGDAEVDAGINRLVSGQTDQYSQTRRRERDGKGLLLKIAVSLLGKDANDHPQFVLFAQDVTEAELKGARLAADNFAHRHNNTLTTILGYAELAKMYLTQDGLGEFLDKIIAACRRMEADIKEFQDLPEIKIQEGYGRIIEFDPEGQSGGQSQES